MIIPASTRNQILIKSDIICYKNAAMKPGLLYEKHEVAPKYFDLSSIHIIWGLSFRTLPNLAEYPRIARITSFSKLDLPIWITYLPYVPILIDNFECSVPNCHRTFDVMFVLFMYIFILYFLWMSSSVFLKSPRATAMPTMSSVKLGVYVEAVSFPVQKPENIFQRSSGEQLRWWLLAAVESITSQKLGDLSPCIWAMTNWCS